MKMIEILWNYYCSACTCIQLDKCYNC